MEINNPWKGIEAPSARELINGKRVDATAPWGFFWATNAEKHQLLVLYCKERPELAMRVPKLKELGIHITEPDESGAVKVVLELHEATYRDIFYRLCQDIVDAARDSKSEAEAANVMLVRTWRWHHLLRGGSDERLSVEEQMGLIGELLVFDKVLLPVLNPLDSVRSWRGPFDSPKDFTLGKLCLEAKARRSSSSPFVLISSEYQLDTASINHLYLYVTDMELVSDMGDSVTVTEYVRRVYEEIYNKDPFAADELEQSLMAAGFDFNHDYSDHRWKIGDSSVYEVREGFPRITPVMYEAGVSKVKYAVSLTECRDYLVNNDVLTNRIKEVSDVNIA